MQTADWDRSNSSADAVYQNKKQCLMQFGDADIIKLHDRYGL